MAGSPRLILTQDRPPPARFLPGTAIRFASRPILPNIPAHGFTAIMPEPTEIEVEVLEIDGVAQVAPRPAPVGNAPTSGDWQDWRQWRGRVRQLDSRWWPLWTVLGIIAVSLLLTVGLVLGVIFLIGRLLAKILRAILP